MKNQAATEEETEIPQLVVPETMIPEVVMQLTDTPQPKPKDPFSKKPKFKADDFFGEHVFFTEFNPYDNAHLRRKRFWTASQDNFYSSILLCSLPCNKFLSPQCILKFKWALENLAPLHPFVKKFQPLVLMKMLLKKWRPGLQMKQKLKFLSLRLQN